MDPGRSSPRSPRPPTAQVHMGSIDQGRLTPNRMPQDRHSADLDAKPAAIVLLSGGMDSCVTTAIANAAHPHRLALVHCSYGQRSERRERRAFDEIADFYAV